MPMYEYVCSSCSHSLEKLQKIDDDPITFCPACENNTLEKQISAAGFRLKGGGWYETDFKSKDKRNLAKSDNASDTGAAVTSNKTNKTETSTTSTADKGK